MEINSFLGDLLGEEYNISLKKDTKKILQIAEENDDIDEYSEDKIKKILKNKKTPVSRRLAIINDRVLKVLGHQRKNIVVITNRDEFHNYIAEAIKSGYIAIDTETNNSTDAITCKLMGLCLYYPGGKQAYIPINHVNYETKERLANQLTEQDCKEELQRINDAKTFVLMHNAKFDYKVILCTCGIKMRLDWDTILAHRLYDENDDCGLKYIYTKYIDKTQAKYDIEDLFMNCMYSWVDPNIFALYAATDALMTWKVYEHYLPFWNDPKNAKLRHLLVDIETKVALITADMELAGVAVDKKLGERLHTKYTNQLEKVDAQIEKEMEALKPVIAKWRLTKEANEKSKQCQPKKTNKTLAEIEAAYPFVGKDGVRYKLGKPKAEQLDDPVKLSSPVQLAIVFYDILKCPSPSKKAPRGTGVEELKSLKAILEEKVVDEEGFEDVEEFNEALDSEEDTQNKKTSVNKAASDLCGLILKRRGILKLLTTYVDVIPQLADRWPDGRVRFNLNSLGTDTGRFSSGGKIHFTKNDEREVISGINIQNIPSKNKEIRMLFKARVEENTVDSVDDNHFVVSEITEVETTTGYKYCKDLVVGDQLVIDGQPVNLLKIGYNATTKEYLLCV